MDRHRRTIHRLGDLDRTGKWLAAAFGAALALAPLLALARYAPDWVPAGDHAFMGLRALEVGTSRTPLIGQPSLSHVYVEEHPVRHIGPSHYYLLAPFVRAFGAPVGMLVVSVLITGGSVLLAAWATFRQLGPTGGALGAVVLSAITFTTGASSLIMPVSSNVARYPFLCSMVLLWCLICGDIRLLPLTVAVVSFTAQQHLSVLPTLLLASVVAMACLGTTWVRSGQARSQAPQLLRWGGLAGGLAAALWLPVVVQQVAGSVPNVSELADFTVSDDRPTLGYGTGLRHVTHAVGIPRLLLRMNPTPLPLFEPISRVDGLVAAAVTVTTVLLAVRWRRTHPRRTALVVMAAVLAIGGLFSSASVPAGWEQFRMVFYHWIFALRFFLTMVLGLALIGWSSRRLPDWREQVRTKAVGVALVAIVGLAVVNPWLHRWSNTMLDAWSPVDRASFDEVTDELMDQRRHLDGSVLLVSRGIAIESDLDEALSLALEERGVSVRHPEYDRMWVSDEKLTDRDDVDAGLVVILDARAPDGRIVGDTAADSPLLDNLVAEAEVPPGFDHDAYVDPPTISPGARPGRIRVFLLDRDALLRWVNPTELAP